MNDYLDIPYANCANYRITLWELLECRKLLKKQETKHVDEALIFEGIAEIRSRISEQTKTSKSNRIKHNKKIQNDRSIEKMPSQKIDQNKSGKNDQIAIKRQIKIPTLKNFDDIERW